MRLIDGDALMEVINRHCYPVQHDMTSIEPGMTRIGILQAIQELPTIEPERKTGKWEEHFFDGPIGRRPKALMCSCCNALCLFAYDYCPKCGAKMEGSK